MSGDTVAFQIGDTVYLRLCGERAGMVPGILFRASGALYLVTWAHDMTERYHFGIELTVEKTFSTKSA